MRRIRIGKRETFLSEEYKTKMQREQRVSFETFEIIEKKVR